MRDLILMKITQEIIIKYSIVIANHQEFAYKLLREWKHIRTYECLDAELWKCLDAELWKFYFTYLYVQFLLTR